MGEEIEKINTESLADKVKDRIRAAFVELIPEEQWKAMVSREIDGFVNDKRDRWGNIQHAALPKIINEALTAYARDRVKKALESPHWEGLASADEAKVNAAIEKLIQDNIGAVVMTVLQNTFRSAVTAAVVRMSFDLKEQIKSDIKNGF